MSLFDIGIDAVERGLVPDFVTRLVIRRLCFERLRETKTANGTARAAFLESMRSSPIALVPDRANAQHYELPAEFFAAILGPRRKYSCCLWSEGATTLAAAEEAALETTCGAGIADGQKILELGCGWGSLTLWMAERFPHSSITAVSNSASQRAFIEAEAARHGFRNLQVITADMNHFSPPTDPEDGHYDRVVSVEMFEHMRNYERLLERIAGWLRPDGSLFIHIFCHRTAVYPFETDGEADWMGRHFFTGGLMPSADLLCDFDGALGVSRHWVWSGENYRRTSEAWLANLDARRNQVRLILASAFGRAEADRWLHRWRMFFMAVAELFGFAGGDEWFVSHYLLEPVR